MRVKKLNVNRRHKPGEDEGAIGVAAGGDSEQRKWVSPTKPLQGALSGSSSGSSSPTDVQLQPQQQHQGEHSPEQFQPSSSSDLFVCGTGGIAAMPNAGADDERNTEKDSMREVMIARIVEMLQAMKPHAPEKVLAALPSLAQNMEKALFKLAKSKAEYCDLATLRLRIAQIQENNVRRLLAQQQRTLEQNMNGNDKVTSSLKLLTEKQARLAFQYLQSWRQKLVNVYGVAPWDILPNSTLVNVALYMPSTEEELRVCGVGNDKIARFGSSLLQELQRLQCFLKPTNKLIRAKPCRKPPNLGKRDSSESITGGNSTKNRKTEDATHLTSMGTSYNGSSLTAPAPTLTAVDSLPTLLPTVSIIPAAATVSATATSNSLATLKSHFTPNSGARCFPSQIPPKPLFARLQPQQKKASSPAQENHMHLLVQGAGQLSKQQNSKSLEAYEQEVQSLRWMLHQVQQEKSQLETEVQRLRAQLQTAHGSK